MGFCNVDHDRLFETRSHYLHAKELEHYHEIEADLLRRSYLRGRYISKEALARYFSEQDFREFNIINGVFNQPIVEYKEGHNRIGVSISHNEEYGIGIAFSERTPMAVDIERCSLSQKEIIKSQITAEERAMAADVPWQSTIAYTMLWTVKEAISKVIKTGLTIPLDILRVEGFEPHDKYVICKFHNFPQYQTISFKIRDHVCSIAIPVGATYTEDISQFVKQTTEELSYQYSY